MLSIMYLARKEKVDDSGFPRMPDRLPGLYGLRVLQSEVYDTIIDTCGPYNLGSSTTTIMTALVMVLPDFTQPFILAQL